MAITVALITALVAPVALDRDGFPLSTYPMYSTARGDSTSFATANGLDNSGERHRLSLGLIGASDDPLVVSGELAVAVNNGRAAARCESIAGRVARSDRSEIVEVEIVWERHRTVDATRGENSLIERTGHARCSVNRQ